MSEAHALLSSVLQVAGLVHERLETALEPTGLSLAKLGALRHLSEAEQPLPLGQLAERIACVKSNVTQLIDRLEAEGLVQRMPDPADRRSVRAGITPQGRERLAAALTALNEAEQAVVTELENNELRTLGQLLERLAVGC